MLIETPEPLRSLFERSHGGENWRHADRSFRHERNARGILAGRRTGSLQANLARHNRLKPDFNQRCNIANQRDRCSLAHRIDGKLNRGRNADALQRNIRASARGELLNVGNGVAVSGVERSRCSKAARHSKASVVHVENEDPAGACEQRCLQAEESNHAGTDDHDRVVQGDWG